MTVRFFNFTDGQNVKLTAERGGYSVIEYQSDMSVNPYEAQLAYFASKMNVRRRQLVCHLDRFPSHCVSMQAGAMQWMSGDVQPRTGIRGAGDFARKLVRGSVTGESAIPVHARRRRASRCGPGRCGAYRRSSAPSRAGCADAR